MQQSAVGSATWTAIITSGLTCLGPTFVSFQEARDTLRAGTAAEMTALDMEIAGKRDRLLRSGEAASADSIHDDEEGATAHRDFQRKIKSDVGALLPPGQRPCFSHFSCVFRASWQNTCSKTYPVCGPAQNGSRMCSL
jgi:hypothetical protein